MSILALIGWPKAFPFSGFFESAANHFLACTVMMKSLLIDDV
jgi:hypothetical protein